MPFQTGSNVRVALKTESAFGVAAGASGATVLRKIASPALKLVRGQIISTEKRGDQLTSQGRLGGKMVQGTYNTELSVASFDLLLAAMLRTSYTAAVAITQATMTSITVTAGPPGTIVAAAGSWLTQGVRVGDIVRLTGQAQAGNNDKNLRVQAVTASTITVPETLVTDAAPDATFTLTILKKLKNPATPVRTSFTIEEYNQDIDLSEQFLGCRLIGASFSLRPNAMATVGWSFLGVDRVALAAGASPYYTTPTEFSTVGLVVDDATIRRNGAAVTTFTGLELNFQIASRIEPVIGGLVSPDVFDNDLSVSGSVTGLRADFANLTLFDAETEFELFCLLTEPEVEPKDCISLYVPRVKIADLDSDIGGDGARVETHQLMIGPKVATTADDAGVVTICTSAA